MNTLCYAIKTAQQLPWNGSLISCSSCGNRELTNNDICRLSCNVNLTRTIICPLCNKGNEEAVISAWQQLKGNDELVVVKEIQLYNNEIKSDSVIDQLTEEGVSYENVCGTPTPMAQLKMELRGHSVPYFLVKNKVPINEAIKLGLTFDMIVGTKTNWDLMFIQRIYTAEDLIALGVTFTRLVWVGMPLDIFLNSDMDMSALHMIQFNRHAFDAAGGTDEKWNLLLKTAKAKSKDLSDALDFGNDYVCKTCRPDKK